MYNFINETSAKEEKKNKAGARDDAINVNLSVIIKDAGFTESVLNTQTSVYIPLLCPYTIHDPIIFFLLNKRKRQQKTNCQ